MTTPAPRGELSAGDPVSRTPTGIPVFAVHTADNSPVLPPEDLPGRAPFTRGHDTRGYLDGPWIMGQYSGSRSPQETNRRFRELLARGQTGFSVALDLPTQVGLDSDAYLAQGEVGRVGAPVSSLRDVEALFDGIDLRKVRQLRTTANSIAPIMGAMFIAAARKQGIEPTQFRVMLQNDSLKEYVARGTQIFPPRWGLKFTGDMIEYCVRHIPNWEPVEYCGYHLRDSGCDAAEEIAIAAANGFAYIRDVVNRGLDVGRVARRSVLFLSAGLELFEEAAKFRAARRLWSDLIEQHFPGAPDHARNIEIFCYTLGGSLVAQEPENNIVRVAYAALAAALGGVQTLATSSYDEALGLPSDHAAKLSLRTQQILGYETGVTRTIDPLGGSYYVEHLTERLVTKAKELFAAIESMGGAVQALENGHIARLLEEGAFRLQSEIESGTRPVVGLNAFADANWTSGFARPTTAKGLSDEDLIARLRDLKELRSSRDQRLVSACLRDVHAAAAAGVNTFPSILAAVEAYATIGEICDELRDVWGTHG